MTTRPNSSSARYAAPAMALSALLFSARAHGDEAGDTATARALGVEGITLADGGRCREAVEKLERAEKLHHAPTTAAWLGECEIELGKLVVGTERLQRVVHEPPGGSPAFAAAVLRAHKRLDEVLPRIPTLRIAVSAPAGAKVTVTIDGEPVPDVAVDTPRPVDPGPHTVQAAARGFFTSSVTTSLVEGQARSVSLELRPDPNAPAAAPAGTAERTARAGGSFMRAPTLVAFGLGALGLGVGIAAGAAAAGRSAALTSGCDANKVCPPALQSDIDAGKRWSTISKIGFIGSGVAVATGVVLLLSTDAARTERRAGAVVHPVVGAGYAGLNGAF
jgi:hypothetical protein